MSLAGSCGRGGQTVEALAETIAGKHAELGLA